MNRRFCDHDFVRIVGMVVYSVVALIIIDLCHSSPSTRAMVTNVDAKIEWVWTQDTSDPASLQPTSMPLVIDLDRDGIPEVVFVLGQVRAVRGSADSGMLRAIRGIDGELLWTADQAVFGFGVPAAGDLDDDGYPEILVADADGNHLIAFEHDGRFRWRSAALARGPRPLNLGAVSLADINHDGHPEILAGGSLLKNDGTILWTKDTSLDIAIMTTAVDLDLSGDMEILFGNQALRSDGSTYWVAPSVGCQGFTSIGNFDDDVFPEIVVVCPSPPAKVYLLEHSGTVLWGPITIDDRIPTGGGGPPVVGDINGDGKPEIGIATSTEFMVLDGSGTIVWRQSVMDNSPGVASAVLYDFDLDGAMDVVFGDEAKLSIFSGRDGQVLWSTASASVIILDLPVVADVNADGHADIVRITNTSYITGTAGVYMYSSAGASWPSTRKIWNQYQYHIDNIDENGGVPVNEDRGWLTHNTFRANLNVVAITPTASPSMPATMTPSATATTSESPTSTYTSTSTPTETALLTETATSTLTATATTTASATALHTHTPSATPSTTSLPQAIYLPLLLSESCPPKGVFSDVILVLDASTSMLERTDDGRRKLDIATAAISSFLDRLRMGSRGDRAGLISFNSQATILQRLTDDRSALQRALSKVDVHQSSRIDLGIRQAVRELSVNGVPWHLTAIVVLSDGIANPVSDSEVLLAAAEAKKTGATMYVVGLGPQMRIDLLQALASGNQRFFVAADPSVLEQVFVDLAKKVPCSSAAYWGHR